ncbi:MAG: hypothetical protein ACKOWF_17710, partial [Chloroflexota bacterium]
IMNRPTLSDYSVAVQNPHVAFTDSALRRAQAETDGFGNPRPRTGGFAVTFKLTDAGKSWAVRCFHKDPGDLHTRYAAIGRTLKSNPSKLFVEFDYQTDGILAKGSRWPVVKMEWVDGISLQRYVTDHHADQLRMQQLLKSFRQSIQELTRLGLAHGDLQHGNILVCNDALVLVDYDGMYVPSMGVSGPREMGHANYQSPLRDAASFGPDLDHFSSLVIATGLQALAAEPGLWKKYSNGDNLLFVATDFANPAASPLFRDLRAITTLSSQVDQLALLCRTPLNQVPGLDAFLAGQHRVTQSAVVAVPEARRQWDLIPGSNRSGLMDREGDQVETFGEIVEAAQLPTSRNEPCWALNFGKWQNGDFRIMVWSEGIRQFEQAGITRSSLEGKVVRITGLIQRYENKRGQVNPYMVVWGPGDFQIIDKKELTNLSKTAGSVRGKASPLLFTPPKPVQPAAVGPSQPKPTLSLGWALKPAQPDKRNIELGTGPNAWPPIPSRSTPSSPGNTNTWQETPKLQGELANSRPPAPDTNPDVLEPELLRKPEKKKPWWLRWR